MPSPSSVWLVSSPLSHAADRDEMVDDIAGKLGASSSSSTSGSGSTLNAAKSAVKRAAAGTSGSITRVEWPDFKTGTLASLLTLADSLNKHDVSFQGTLDKIVETIRTLTVNDKDSATFNRHLLTEDGQPYLSPLTSDPESHPDETSQGWSWNRAKYRVEGRALGDIVDSLAKDMQSLDTIHKQKQSSYNLAKGQLATLQRKRTGNLATRDLSTVLTQDEIPQIGDSEYLQVVFVAVPKNNVKDFEAKYERLAGMVVPRSANKIAQDEEFALYTVTIFKRIRDDFTQKCREEKFLVREYSYDEAVIEKQKAELAELEASEKDLWTDLLRISRINFAEAFSLLIHLKVIASYVECVLRYGLPAEYFICSITPAAPDEKSAKKTLKILQDYFKDFTPDTSASHARLVGGDSQKNRKKKNNSSTLDESALVGEFQNLMEEEHFRFVLQEIPTYSRTSEGR